MSAGATVQVIERIFRTEHARAVGAVTRVLGDLGLAEDAVSEAYLTALRTWPDRGLPDNAGAWITTTARNRGLDRIRREAKRGDKEAAAVLGTALGSGLPVWTGGGGPGGGVGAHEPDPADTVEDDQLRLLFTCAHPALAPETRVALTLRLVAGLRTAEIARAFLRPEATVAQRLSRAKRRIRTAGIAFRVPPPERFPERLPAVLACIELIYREGYAATGGDQLVRGELCTEGLRLARLLASLLPGEPEALGLLALLGFLDARRDARVTADGDLVLLEDQDRGRFDRSLIAEATRTLERAAASRRPGPYQLRAAIAAEHATAEDWHATDWAAIERSYAVLAQLTPSPVVELNRAVAISFVDGPAAGLAHLERLADDPRLARSHLLPATRADLLRRLERHAEAVDAYQQAVESAPTSPERRYLQERLDRSERAARGED